jgi:hypothetical protein
MARPVHDAIQLTAEQHQFLELATDFAARDIRPVARVVDDAQVESPLDLWRAAAKIGLTAFMLPADVGGGGVTDLLTQARIQEELCHGDITIGNLVTSNGFYAAPILELGTAEQRARWLEPLGTCRDTCQVLFVPNRPRRPGLRPSGRDRRPSARVVTLHGDGGLMFTAPELATAAALRLPLPVVVVDNSGYGEVKREMLVRGDMPIAVDLPSPDFAGLARSLGCHGVAAPDDLAGTLAEVFDTDRPTLIHVADS